MLIQEVTTDLPPGEVLSRAKEFFTLRFSPYGGFLSDESEQHVRFTNEVAELVIGAAEKDGRTEVRGSTSRMHNELSQFLASLDVPGAVRESLPGPGTSGAG